MCGQFLSGFFFFQAEDGIRDYKVTGVQTCALPISDETSFVFMLVTAQDGCIHHNHSGDRHMLLKDRVAIITGGAGINGLGFATARQMAAQGRSEERRVGKECRSRWSPYH